MCSIYKIKTILLLLLLSLLLLLYCYYLKLRVLAAVVESSIAAGNSSYTLITNIY